MHVSYLKLSIANYDLLLTTLTKHNLCRLYRKTERFPNVSQTQLDINYKEQFRSITAKIKSVIHE